MNIVGFIFARGGSKGVPRKNLRQLAGKPLIAHAIEAARRSALIERVIVSTDDLEIAACARQFGASTPFLRPTNLATDEAPEVLAWQHALQETNRLFPQNPVEVFVSVPPTAPLRSPSDIDACIDALLKGNADGVLTVCEAHRNPYFNMVSLDSAGYASLAMSPETGSQNPNIARRQDAPAMFDVATVAYALWPRVVLRAQPLFSNRIRAVAIPKERALDIDTELDFELAEFLLSRHAPLERPPLQRRSA